MRRLLSLLILALVLTFVTVTYSTTVASAGRQGDPAAPDAADAPDAPDAPDAAEAASLVYWTEVVKGTIMRGSANGSGNAQTCVTGQQDPRGLVIVAEQNQMYWLDRGAGKLRRANLNCPAGNIFTYGHTLVNPDRLAVDLDSGYLYWTENQTSTVQANRIRRAKMDGSGSVETVISGLNAPVGIAIATVSGTKYLYWTEFENDAIYRMPISGGSKQLLVNLADDVNPLDIVVDVDGGQIYWLSGVTDGIFSATLTGGSPGLWITASAPRSMVLDRADRMLYFAAQGSDEIRRVKMDKTGNQLLFDKNDGVDRSLGVALVLSSSPTCYQLTRTRNNSSGGSVPGAVPGSSTGCSSGKYIATQSITLNASPADGWRVAGWTGTNNDASTATSNTVTMPANNHTAGVIYELIPVECFALTRTRNITAGGNIPTASPGSSTGCGSGNYTTGQSITLTATPAAGYRVAGWTGTNNDASTSTTNTVNMPNGNHTAGVIYELIPVECFPLTRARSNNDGGSIPTASPAFSTGCGTGHYKDGELITVTAAPNSDWHVAGWSGTNNDSSTSTTNTVTMPNGAHLVVVVYEQTTTGCFTLGRTRTGQGAVPVAAPAFSTGCGTAHYKNGELITLTAAPAAGWRVAGWTGTNNDGSTATTNTVNMPNGNYAVSVIYEAVCYALGLSHTGSGSNPAASPGSSAGCGAGQYTAGQSITLTASPALGWHVAGWSGTNNDAATSTTNTVIMPATSHAAGVDYETDSGGTLFFAMLPGVLDIPYSGPTCFAGPGEAEPNNTAATANGPLCSPGSYSGLPNDQMDYFTFTTSSTGRIIVDVGNHRGEGVQLLLYLNNVGGNPVAEDNNQHDGLRVDVPNAAPGHYYIIIYTETPKPNESQRYTMSISYQ